MKTPLDCQLLRLGLKYVVARSSGDLEAVTSILAPQVSDDIKSELKTLTVSSACQSQMRNLFYIHADVTDNENPRVVLKFPLNLIETLHVRSVSVTHCPPMQIKVIFDIIREVGNEQRVYKITMEGDHCPMGDLQESTSSLDLLSVAVPYSISDALVDLSFQPQHMTSDMKAFGLVGKEAILAHSEEFLGPQGRLGKPAYALQDPFIVDVTKRMVTLGFECLIEGFEGKGTDYVYFDKNNKILELVAVRHTGSFDPCLRN